MNEQSDSQLLQAYVERRSEAAFAELVCRHVDLVYSAARRMVCDPQLAQDVAQGVFVALAKNAGQLAGRPVLAGWLHRTAQNIAAQTVRTDVRRRAREQEAAAMNELLSDVPEVSWEQVAGHLDVALGELGETDRDALMLRYFQNKPLREVGKRLGVSDDAAQKRVGRAVERLREFLAKRGVAAGASGLAVVLSANAVQAAPNGLAATISAAALSGTAVTATTIFTTTTKTIAMTTLQKTLVTATVAMLAGAGIYKAHQATQLGDQVRSLQDQQGPLMEQIQNLQLERDGLTNQLSVLAGNLQEEKKNSLELLKLRAEVTRLRNDSAELAKWKTQMAESQPAGVNGAKSANDPGVLLQQELRQMPDKNIPELQGLEASKWTEDASRQDLNTEDGVRQALANLRRVAKMHFAYDTKGALNAFVKANDGQLPTDLSQLAVYYAQPVDAATFQRYQLLQTGSINDLAAGTPIIGEKAPVDDEYDTLFQVGLNGVTMQGTGKWADQHH